MRNVREEKTRTRERDREIERERKKRSDNFDSSKGKGRGCYRIRTKGRNARKEAIVFEWTNNELNAISRVGDTSGRSVYTGVRMKYRNSFGAPRLWQDALPIPLWRDSVQNSCARRNVCKRPHPVVRRNACT